MSYSYADDFTSGSAAVGQGCIGPDANCEMELLAVMVGAKQGATAGPSGNRLPVYSGTPNLPGSTHPEKMNSRSIAFGGLVAEDINVSTVTAGRLIVMGETPNSNSAGVVTGPYAKWRPPRCWLRPKKQDPDGFMILLEGTWSTNEDARVWHTIIYDYQAQVALPRLARRPSRREGWHYFQEQRGSARALGWLTTDGAHRGDQNNWCARNPPTINSRYQAPNLQNLLTGTGPALTPIQLDASLTLIPAMQLEKFKALAASLGMAPAIQRMQPRAVPATLTLTPAQQKEFFKTLAASEVNSPTLVRTKLVPLPVGLTMGSAMQRKLFRALAFTLTLSPAISFKAIRPRALAATLTLSTTLNRGLFKTLPVGLTAAPAMIRTKLVSLAVGLTLSPAMQRIQARTFNTPLTLSPAMQLKKFRALSTSLSLSVAMQLEKFRTLSVVLTLSAAMQRMRPISLPASLVLTPAFSFKTIRPRTLAASMVLSPAMIVQPVKRLTIAAGLTLSPALVRLKVLTVSLPVGLTLTALMKRLPLKQQDVTLNLQPTMLRKEFVRLDALLTGQPTLAKRAVHYITLSAPLTLTAALQRHSLFFKRLDAGLSLVSDLVRRPNKQFDANLVMEPDIKRRLFNAMAAVLSLIPGLNVDSLSPPVFLDPINPGDLENDEPSGRIQASMPGGQTRGRQGRRGRGRRGGLHN